ncbi:peptide deformylase [Candidatus Daviesbacteria bacterium RIFCSPLOWO2_02_FULL_40_8]|uniref:Peptide deformylase n=1 Tax=Candidatus Daviesbacteria bacterium RIFCSPLOWO2_01_FULL_40_24 TaxID=1797787 RepID=A0A1F5MJK8_9BACT|nr:MAG: peptide deformylase [Candidatus Daviesbacteria bacterium RIFCSPHIGHO2_01_FULL_41_45]OGE35474.1 MAG: peptide deformylase [Candidatus Daviesbacteria bacterium RIFCSPHIGHO2_02_FULL_41_14]OGE65564.1 MAG: peptide deformylase [Candidatus Daviesbacteria bacterium RIFCSPLOWO2_01_FULL_40_24]OGE67148.1 MAG: peptide deformylase [Candidatus Daviesbacteria bacterium RIFCSPLOWO2_02_FULL_40_8]
MEIVKAPDARLRVKTKQVKKITPELLKTIKEMVLLTKSFADPEGVGLAATQIGNGGQYFVSKTKSGSFRSVINPAILNFSKKTKVFFEGCLSIPDYYGEVKRPIGVTVLYLDEKGQKIKKKLTGLEAWIFQHEYDHLQGKLFVDYVLAQKSRLYKVVGKDKTGAEVFEEVSLEI